jgi:hypothetical protein
MIEDQGILLDTWIRFVASNLVWRISSVHRPRRLILRSRVSEQND